MKTKHSGFTLIELVVVIGILLALASIVVLFFPSMQEQTRAARGAALLQGWLQVAKTRALRDRAPRGLRLLVSGNTVSQCQYIEQPDDYFGSSGTITLTTPNDNSTSVVFNASYPPNINIGDFLEIGGVGNVHRIGGVNFKPPPYQITLDSPIRFQITSPTNNYRIIRAPVPAGDEILQLPTDVAVLVENNPKNPLYSTSSKLINIGNGSQGILSPPNIDIMFSPSGAVFNKQITFDVICLWVGDTTAANPLLGEPTLIGVHVRSGLIAAHPVNPSDYFSFVRDGKSSGK